MKKMLDDGTPVVYNLNKDCYIKSLRLDGKHVAVVGCHDDSTEKLLKQHNAMVNVDGVAVNHIVVDDSTLMDWESVIKFIRLRVDFPDAQIFSLSDYQRKLATNDDPAGFDGPPDSTTKFLKLLRFYRDNLDGATASRIIAVGGVFDGVFNVCIVGKSAPVPPKDHHKLQRLSNSTLFVTEEWMSACLEAKKLVAIDKHLCESLPLSDFLSCKQELSGVKFLVDQNLGNLKCGANSYAAAIQQALQSLGATVTQDADEAVGMIGAPFRGGATDSLVTRNVFCLIEIIDHEDGDIQDENKKTRGTCVEVFFLLHLRQTAFW